MTLDLTSQLYQDAVAITGHPSYITFGRHTLVDREPVSAYVVESCHEHHFRVWLEGHECIVARDDLAEDNFRRYEAIRHHGACPVQETTYKGQLTELILVTGPTYLECQMMAVVEIDSNKTGPAP